MNPRSDVRKVLQSAEQALNFGSGKNTFQLEFVVKSSADSRPVLSRPLPTQTRRCTKSSPTDLGGDSCLVFPPTSRGPPLHLASHRCN